MTETRSLDVDGPTRLLAAIEHLCKDVHGDGYFETDIPGLIVMRSSVETRPQCILYQPALCLIVQGAKEMAAGGARVHYRAGQSLIITADTPTLGHVIEASRERPYIGIGLGLDIAVVRSVMEALPLPLGGDDQPFQLFVEQTSAPVEDCILKLVKLAGDPGALRFLQPAIMREICYWLLAGPNGVRIARQVGTSTTAVRIAGAVQHLRKTFNKPVRVADLAASVNMSPSSFFQHFKSATSLTPLQFQKQLRLMEARRLMITENISVANAATHVGYESSSQFSREYRRLFGRPPAREATFFAPK